MFLDALSSFFEKGGLATTLVETIKDYFPPDMSEQEKALLSIKIQEAATNRETVLLQLAMEADRDVTERTAKLEGTASDLKQLPIVGRLILFLRGCQRPLWGFAALYMDLSWFTLWKLTDRQETALIVINTLVLGFLFGERTIKNLEPLLLKVFGNNEKVSKE